MMCVLPLWAGDTRHHDVSGVLCSVLKTCYKRFPSASGTGQHTAYLLVSLHAVWIWIAWQVCMPEFGFVVLASGSRQDFLIGLCMLSTLRMATYSAPVTHQTLFKGMSGTFLRLAWLRLWLLLPISAHHALAAFCQQRAESLFALFLVATAL